MSKRRINEVSKQPINKKPGDKEPARENPYLRLIRKLDEDRRK
jgi:hypothetical protein